MSNTIRVRHKIPITDQFGEGILFDSWLPKPQEVIGKKVEDFQVEIWLDPVKFQVGAFPADSHSLSKVGDLRIGTIGLDVLIEDVSNELVRFIRSSPDGDRSIEVANGVSDAYELLGKQVMKLAVESIQDVISYFRVVKAQFWIPIFKFDLEDLARFNTTTRAKVLFDDGTQVSWKPSRLGVIKVRIFDWGWRKAKSDDWKKLEDFINRGKSPPLSLELMAASESYEFEGKSRIALVEAVAALEIALRKFVISLPEDTCGTTVADLGVKNLEVLHEKLGLRGTLAILLPLILPKERLPREALRKTIEAVEIRGTIVHRGRRNLDAKTIRKSMNAIRELTMMLEESTNSR